MDSMLQSLLRPGRSGRREERLDLLWLAGLLLVMVATGIGLRDPWPADEPRFALIARDMVATHQWLVPSVGGDIYPDKPPLFFWMIAALLSITGSLRLSFLLPSLLAAAGCIALVYDLGRRLWNREVGLAAGLALLFTAQFVWQARQAQIDATLCFFTTLGLYGLLRHCLLGPDWKWYAVGWAACGFGIITKGVGFLPLLVLIPYAFMRSKQWTPRPAIAGGARWFLGPIALLLAVSVWLVPMLIAAQHDPVLQRYRDEILFGQTVHRYAGAWHHREPFWYFIVNVIPGLWLPFTLLLPWLIPHWRESLRSKDLRTCLLLAWIVLVVVFFSLSTGKRGVYILPAVPALALAVAPYLAAVAQRRRAQIALFVLVAVFAAMMLLGAAYMFFNAHERQKLIELYDIDVLGPLLIMGIGAVVMCLIARPARGFLAWGLVLGFELLVVSFVINPVINDTRSGAELMRTVEAHAKEVVELGVVAYKEQYLLQAHRRIVNFGHARWREGEQEASDAAAWLAASPDRVLLMDESTRALCFSAASAEPMGIASREQWYLVKGAANPACIARGHVDAAIEYTPPSIKSD
jgi:4-amino-4-deoxy-L-arabinose transferase-like glycosyltransferase